MRVVVVGATGNVGTSLLRALRDEPEVESIVGVARRRPSLAHPKTEWVGADISFDDLDPIFRGADAVVHLAWLIQPARDLARVRGTNVGGSRRVFEAAARAGVRAIVYASSVGTYARGPKDRLVDESWPTTGVPTSFYSRHKAQVEAMLDSFEEEHPNIRVARLRPALIFKREAASGVRRLFIGPFLPSPLLRKGLILAVPRAPRLRFQCLHSYDVADAYRLALVNDVHGAFNVAADPILDGERLAEIFGARSVSVPPKVMRRAFAVSWRLRLQPSPEGWIDMAIDTPLLDSSRARNELGWEPRFSSEEALMDLFEGLRERAGLATPPLERDAGGPLRVNEFLSGIGSRP